MIVKEPKAIAKARRPTLVEKPMPLPAVPEIGDAAEQCSFILIDVPEGLHSHDAAIWKPRLGLAQSALGMCCLTHLEEVTILENVEPSWVRRLALCPSGEWRVHYGEISIAKFHRGPRSVEIGYLQKYCSHRAANRSEEAC